MMVIHILDVQVFKERNPLVWNEFQSSTESAADVLTASDRKRESHFFQPLVRVKPHGSSQLL